LRIDLEAGTYTLFRPGNPEILYWNPQQKKVEVLRPAGVVLGNASSTLVKRILEKHTGPLIPGATWLFFSDGFTEATNLQGEQFGLERILHLFQAHVTEPPEAIARHILQAVQDFVGDTHLGDDGTLIVVRYQP
jgi:sigma-B regulation protein RsbU (phosphoserine phosphatase)